MIVRVTTYKDGKRHGQMVRECVDEDYVADIAEDAESFLLQQFVEIEEGGDDF